LSLRSLQPRILLRLARRSRGAVSVLAGRRGPGGQTFRASLLCGAKENGTMNENADIIRRLERQRQQMVNYINLRLELEDWHGVRDAAADLEAIDAQIRLLRLTGKEFKPS